MCPHPILHAYLNKYVFILIQLKDCADDDAFRAALMTDKVFEILDKIGYRGVPMQETLSSRDTIIRYFIKAIL